MLLTANADEPLNIVLNDDSEIKIAIIRSKNQAKIVVCVDISIVVVKEFVTR